MFRSLSTLLLLLILQINLSASTTPAAFFNETDALLMRYVDQGRIDYASLKESNALRPLLDDIAAVDLGNLNGNERKAYLINAYNLLVIGQALEHYPLNSVLDVNGFFDGKKQTVGGRQLTLNQLEKDLILREYNDARLHFVLVCGALGCPPITSFAYKPTELETQLDHQTQMAINDRNFIKVTADGSEVQLSKIFEWYARDFGGSQARVLDFINGFRNSPINNDSRVSYYDYDWSLNQSAGRTSMMDDKMEGEHEMMEDDKMMEDHSVTPSSGGNNSSRYVVSSAIQQGSFEIKVFNNLYSQEAAGERASFFTSSTSVLYGLTNRINVGFDLRLRRVRYDEAGTASNFDVFSGAGDGFSRTAVSGFGPKVRIAPVENLPNFSVQSALWLPIANDLTGAESGQRFVDFDGPTWFTQFFNDFPVGRNFSLFAEVDVVLEDIGNAEAGRINRFSTPITGIVSYFPTPKTTVYGLASYSPYWQENNDYFYQLGAGVKYQFTPKLELELLATAFNNQFLQSVNGNAGTVNLGFRFNL